MYKIYIIEDDANIASLIVEHLAKYQFECFTVQQFPHIIEEFNTIQPHLSLWISISRLTMAIFGHGKSVNSQHVPSSLSLPD